MKKKNHIFMFYKRDMKKNKEKNKEKTRKMNMIEEHRSVKEDGTLYFRDVVHIKEQEYKYSIKIKKVIIGSSVQTIEQWAFSESLYLEEIIFEEPCQIEKIRFECFATCPNLRKIDLPSSIQKIENNSFCACPLERVILRGPYHIGYYCFRTNALTYLHIADSIQKLDEKAFYQNTGLPFSESPCKIYIRPEFHDEIKRMFQGRSIEFIGNELEEGYVLK